MSKDLVARRAPFSEAAVGFGDGRDSPRAFLEGCLEAIERAEPTVKAFVHLDIEGARRAADEATRRHRGGRPLSPIDGMPIGVKDIIDTADMPTQMNSPIYEGHQPACDAACIRATREGGGVILGKTVTTEFAIGRSGPTVNPHDVRRTPGGSSSGSAAGVAAGMVAAAFGTQTQGSVLRPASFTGIVGYKPTLGALSMDGVHPLSGTHDHLGVLADSVDDAWWLARWVSEHAVGQGHAGLSGPGDGRVAELALGRVGVLRTAAMTELDAGSAAAFEGALERLRDAGVGIVEPDADGGLAEVARLLDHVPPVSIDLVAYDMRWPFLGYLDRHPDELGPRIQELMGRAVELTREAYRLALAFREDLRRRVATLADRYDALVLPASSGPAPKGLAYTGSRTFLVYWSFLGFPSFSLPVMEADGLSFGLQLAGFPKGDYGLVRQAKWLMAKLGAAPG